MSVSFLLVTCCKDPTRAEILSKVIANLRDEAPALGPIMTVFDNASTEEGVREQLTSTFNNVIVADKNVGYWSAIDWWLEQQKDNPPDYTYIIESDVIHYGFNKLWTCEDYLDRHPDVGSVRLLEYSVANRHLYNKDAPVAGSRISAWQSHTNRANGKRIILEQDEGEIYRTSFLTQLCALNRYSAMRECFLELRNMGNFSELDFQKLYWKRFTATGLLDGGIFHGELSTDRTINAAIGSWTPPEVLSQMGYQTTRTSFITPIDQYTTTRL